MILLSRSFFFFLIFLIISSNNSLGQIFEVFNDDVFSSNTNISFGSSWIDYNNDGFQDIFITNVDAKNNLLINKSGKFFEPFELALENDANSFAVSWADVNSDGLPDYFVANFGSPSNIYIQQKDGSFIKSNQDLLNNLDLSSQGGAWLDIDNDLDLDLLVANTQTEPSGKTYLLINDGDGKFEVSYNYTNLTSQTNVHAISPADYDNDGDIDLVMVKNTNKPNILFINNNGSFIAKELPNSNSVSLGASWADFDNDGKLDLLITNSINSVNQLYKNIGDGNLEEIKINPFSDDAFNSNSSCWGDFDNDGDLDVFITNSGNQRNNYYRNNGNGSFSNPNLEPLLSNETSSRGCSIGDFNNDGFLDLIETNGFGNDDRNVIYQNTGNANNWLQLSLKDENNSTPIGAKVTVYISNDLGETKTLTSEITAQSGAYGHNSYQIHFGLGNYSSIQSINISWPDGEYSKIELPEINKILNVNK